MQQWRDEAIILASSRHGEQSAVVHALTQVNGRVSGYLRAAKTPRLQPLIQPGNIVALAWQARLADQLGYFAIEPLQAGSPRLMQTPDLARVLQSFSQILLMALPERQPYPGIFDGSKALLQGISHNPDWAEAYIWWELHLLSALGFGLRLEECAVTSQKQDLTHVSPKTGRAVSREAATPYAERLLKLPAFLGGPGASGAQDVVDGLALTGYFLHHHIAEPQGKTLPEARQRLGASLTRRETHQETAHSERTAQIKKADLR